MFCSRCGGEVENSAKFCPSCGLDLASNTPLGRTSDEPTGESEIDLVREALAAEYRVEQELGRGGMAIVFQAVETQLDRQVAVKVLPFSLAFDKEFVERFQREARTAAKLEHPHIIPIYRVGRAGRVIYFVMKYIRGGALSDKIEQHAKVPLDEIRRLLIETAGALGYAHRHGIVHRDIKPDNIMFDAGHAIVTDFGIAKAASGSRLTGTGMSIGTPHYMSPEQARAQGLDGRSDIYSLGVVAFQCLTGHVPFDGEDAFAIGYKHIMEELPTPPLATNEERQLFRVIKKMMAKTPEERFQDAEELVAVLEGRATVPLPTVGDPRTTVSADARTVALPKVAGRLASTPPQPRPGSSALQRPSTPTTPIPRTQPKMRAARPKKKNRGGLIAASLLLLLGGGGAGGYYYYANYLEPRGGIRVLLGDPEVQTDTASAAPGDSARLAMGASVTPPDSTAAPDSLADSTTVAAVLDTMGYLALAGVPPGGRWYLNGQRDQGFRSTDTVRLQPASYRIEVAASGYQALSTNGVVEPGKVAVIRVRPERVPQPVCDTFANPNYNLRNACFDTAPRLDGTPVLALNPNVESATPTPAVLWVRVSPDGLVVTVTQKQPSSDPQFTIQAIQFARQAQYHPAAKGGRPVEAWFQLQLIGRRQ